MLERKVGEHTVLLQALSKEKVEQEDSSSEIFEEMKQSFQTMMQDMQDEMTVKLKSAYSEIERLRKQVTILKGEQNIHSEMLRDQKKQMTLLEGEVATLKRDINGDEDDYD